jgi:c-di-GMP-binding flagellar brake protein YcgR
MELPDTPKKTPDRRRALRSPIIIFKVEEEDDRGHLFGYAQNISCSGLFITSINPRTPGEQFTISFQIPDTQISVRCRCRVVWMRKYDPKIKAESGYGVRFLDIPEEVARAIDAWVIQRR